MKEKIIESNVENKLSLIGSKFPQIIVQTTQGIKEFPKTYAGKWFVLFSHPGDFTPVCTTEFAAFAKKQDKFKKLNCELIGLSIDQVFSHLKWVEWIKDNLSVEIQFPIIADELGELATMLNMIHPEKGTNTVRAVYIVDPEMIIRAIFYYPQEIGRNTDEILRVVKALQISDKNGVAMPADWPDNDLMGEEVIIPPSTDEKVGKERTKKYKCYDWWFCHKKLEE